MVLREVDRSRAGWWLLGAALFAALVFVLHSFVGTFVFGVFIYYSTRPLYRRIRRRVRPSSLAAAVALFALAMPALLLVGYAALVVLNELDRLTTQATFDPSRYPELEEFLRLTANPGTLTVADLESYLTAETVESLLASLGSLADTLAFFGIGAVHLFVMVALAFYLLRDDHRLSAWTRRTFGDDDGVLQEFLRAVDRDLDRIFFGNILNAAVTGTIGVIVYTLLNTVAPPGHAIPAAALVGLLAGVASLIPVVGMKLVYVPVALYMVARAVVAGSTEVLWFVAAFAAASFVVVDTIPDLVLRPYVSGRSLHVGSVMVAYTLGPLLFGWYGIFLMPILLVFVVHFGRVALPELIGREPPTPTGVDPTYIVTGTEGAARAEMAATDGDGGGSAVADETATVSAGDGPADATGGASDAGGTGDNSADPRAGDEPGPTG
jgi:predicted PurR-regulated permease PerM